MSTPASQTNVTHPAALWGIFGFILILSQAIFRLAPLAWEPIASGSLEVWQWGLLGLSVLFNGYFEGYRAFQLQVAPRVIARACYLAEHPRVLHVIFAPLFCMTLFHASRKRLIISRIVYVCIIIMVIGVKQLLQPWRGIVDAGVVIGLGWGIIAIVVAFIATLRGAPLKSDAELPGGE